jgi:hypothetical protein
MMRLQPLMGLSYPRTKSASDTSGTGTTMDSRGTDNDGNSDTGWGWVGLLGLAGGEWPRDIYCFFDNTDIKLRAPFDATSLMRKLNVQWNRPTQKAA